MEVTLATSADLRFILQMQRQESNALGFIPAPRLEVAIERKRILLARAGQLQLGYAFYGSCRSGTLPVHQLVTEPGVRRRTIGEALVRRVELHAALGGCLKVRCHCREDLEANEFWSALGFDLRKVERGGRGRGKLLNTWASDLFRVTRGDHYPDRRTAARASRK